MQCEENKSTSRRSESQAHVVSPVLGHVSMLPVRRCPDAQPTSHGLDADWSRRSLVGGVVTQQALAAPRYGTMMNERSPTRKKSQKKQKRNMSSCSNSGNTENWATVRIIPVENYSWKF
ncbi:hypothetical protein CBL_01380 [Carabus blaptoides fortunei]